MALRLLINVHWGQSFGPKCYEAGLVKFGGQCLKAPMLWTELSLHSLRSRQALALGA